MGNLIYLQVIDNKYFMVLNNKSLIIIIQLRHLSSTILFE